jgi:hypothetical protein
MATVTSILMALFCFDVVYSQFHMNTGKGITDMASLINDANNQKGVT